MCCGVLQCVVAAKVGLRAGIYQIRAHVWCSLLRCVTVWCSWSALRCVAVCCSPMGVRSGVHQIYAHIYCDVLLRVAMCCSRNSGSLRRYLSDMRTHMLQFVWVCCCVSRLHPCCFLRCLYSDVMYTCMYLDVGSVCIYELCIHTCVHIYKRDAHASTCTHACIHLLCVSWPYIFT